MNKVFEISILFDNELKREDRFNTYIRIFLCSYFMHFAHNFFLFSSKIFKIKVFSINWITIFFFSSIFLIELTNFDCRKSIICFVIQNSFQYCEFSKLMLPKKNCRWICKKFLVHVFNRNEWYYLQNFMFRISDGYYILF